MDEYHGRPGNDAGEGGDRYSDTETYECPGCGKEYKSRPDYIRHYAECVGVMIWEDH